MGADLRLVAEVGVCCRQALPALYSQTGVRLCRPWFLGLVPECLLLTKAEKHQGRGVLS